MLTIFGLKLSAQECQQYGLYLGGSINWMSLDKSLYYDDSEPFTRLNMADTTMVSVFYLPVKNGVITPNAGFAFGGFYEYQVSDMVGLQLDLLISQNGYKMKGEVTQYDRFGTDSTTYSYKANLKMTNIGAAVMLKIHPIEHLSIDLGVHPSYCFKLIKDSQRDINRKTYSYKAKDEYNPLNVSAVLGATAYLGDFLFSVRYTLGFSNILKCKTPYLLHDEEGPGSIQYAYTDAKSTASSVMITIGFRIRQ